MEYKVIINEFEGPLDLLLHLLKEAKMEITEIKIDEITKQYLDYIEAMEEMNLDIASEYLIMAAELIEMKSRSLLPRMKDETEDEYEEDPREQLIARLLEYKRYKEMTSIFEELEEERKEVHTKDPEDLRNYKIEEPTTAEETMDVQLLIQAFQKFLQRKERERPLHTKITKKEYSVSKRSHEIRSLLKKRKKVLFEELFDIYSKDYIVVTFLSILDLTRKQEINVAQESNFSSIILSVKE